MIPRRFRGDIRAAAALGVSLLAWSWPVAVAAASTSSTVVELPPVFALPAAFGDPNGWERVPALAGADDRTAAVGWAVVEGGNEAIDLATGRASYAQVVADVRADRRPDPSTVRPEEIVHAPFYDYTPPGDGSWLAVTIEVLNAPWDPRHRLVRIAFKAAEELPARADGAAPVIAGIRADVRWNPEQVRRYRRVAAPVTRDDAVAATVPVAPAVAFSAGAEFTALYEVEVANPGAWDVVANLGRVEVSHDDPAGNGRIRRGWDVVDHSGLWLDASPETRLTVALGAMGLRLAGDAGANLVGWYDLARWVGKVTPYDVSDRMEAVALFNRLRSLPPPPRQGVAGDPSR